MPNNQAVSNEIPPNVIGIEMSSQIFVIVDYEQIKYINQGCCQFTQSQPHWNLPEIWPSSGLHLPVQK